MTKIGLFAVAAAASLNAIAASSAICGIRTKELPGKYWNESEWISAKDARTLDETGKRDWLAAPGASYFQKKIVNAKTVKKVRWMTSGLGVYEIFLNGRTVGREILKPGYTHANKTKLSFTYDLTSAFNKSQSAENVFSAVVGSGWWSDRITGFAGKKPAFRSVILVEYEDGSEEVVGTRHDSWLGSAQGPVTFSGIYDGEGYDARVSSPVFPAGSDSGCEKNSEFKGAVIPSEGAEIYLRNDLTLSPVSAYIWKDTTGAKKSRNKKDSAYGKVKITKRFDKNAKIELAPGETLIVDFGQNCSAVPEFKFSAEKGVKLVCLPAEILNDSNGEASRGNDGPAGSVYRRNMRMSNGMKLEYTFGESNAQAVFSPRLTFFGYRYISVSATGKVVFDSIRSIPVTSISKEMETGSIETGRADVNRLIANTYWGQLSNYLSVPTDCPQRNERLGWTADTQVFAETGAFNANTLSFMKKWMRDMRDSQHRDGAYPSVAPRGPYGGNHRRIGWGDAGVIVPWTMWRQFGDTAIIKEQWNSMVRYMDMIEKADNWGGGGQYADWLSFESFEAHMKREKETENYWKYLGGCYWLLDAEMMVDMAKATGRQAESRKYATLAVKIREDLKKKYFSSPDGMISPEYRHMQTPALFALKLHLVDGDARKLTITGLRDNFKNRGNCLSTGFLGTSILMDVLSEAGLTDLAYDVLLNHNFPGWLYSVDQGATTIWERWNSYTKEKGFGDAGMNSFNHYAYGAVVAWIYKTAAGIQTGDEAGWKHFALAPQPSKKLGSCKASFRTKYGTIKSEWKYKDGKCVWKFSIPRGTQADVKWNGKTSVYGPGDYTLEK